MRRAVVDIRTGKTRFVDLTPGEIADLKPAPNEDERVAAEVASRRDLRAVAAVIASITKTDRAAVDAALAAALRAEK